MCPARSRTQAPPAGPRAMLLPHAYPRLHAFAPSGDPQASRALPISQRWETGSWRQREGKDAQLLSGRARGKPRLAWLQSECQNTRLFCCSKPGAAESAWPAGEGGAHGGPPRCRGGREAAGSTLSRGRCLMLGVRKGQRVNKGFLPSPRPSLVPSPRPAAGAGATFCPQTRCPGCKQI